jgi:hypothetical protein
MEGSMKLVHYRKVVVEPSWETVAGLPFVHEFDSVDEIEDSYVKANFEYMLSHGVAMVEHNEDTFEIVTNRRS